MRRFFILFAIFIPHFALHAQLRETPALTWEDFVQEYVCEEEASGESPYTEEQLQWLEGLAQNPLQLNRATRADLLSLAFLSEEQADSILSYRRAKRGFASLGELQLVRGMDYFTRRYLSLFLRCDSAALPRPELLARREAERRLAPKFGKGRHEVETRLDVPLYRRKGHRTPESPTPSNYYAGNALHHVVRYRYAYRREVAYGLTVEKDAGEPVGKQGFYPYDYLSAYVMARPLQRPWSFVIGDFEVRGGRGLLFGNRFFSGREALLRQPPRPVTGFRPHTSTDEARFFRGGAAAYRFKAFDFMAFASYRKLDARFEEGTDTVRTLLQTGLHRTVAEVERRRNVGNVTTGIHAGYNRPGGGCSLDAYVAHYDCLVWPEESFYNAAYFRGQTAAGASVSYYYRFRRLNVQGEVAVDRRLHAATEHLVGFSFSPRLSLNAQVRHFSPRYVSLYGDALQQGSRPSNEQGVALGVRYLPRQDWELSGYADFFRFPKPTYHSLLPGAKGMETSLQSQWRFSGAWQFGVRYRLKTRQRTITGHELLEYRYTHKLRLSALWSQPAFTLRMQADAVYASRQTGARSWGWMASLRSDWKPTRRCRLKAFAGLFFTDDYDSAIYAYEPQLLRAGGFPSFAYHGVRAVLLNQWQVFPSLQLGVRASSTCYFNRTSISSGPAQIPSAWKNDLSVQLRWRL